MYLLDAASAQERRLLSRWLDRNGVDEHQIVDLASSRRGRGGALERIAELVETSPESYLIPLRVVWMAPENRGRRSVGWSDALKPGDPRDPRGLRAWWIRTFSPERVRLIGAEGETAARLAEDHGRSGEVDGVAAFVNRRAWLALDRVERRVRGNRYKIPRFVPEAISSRHEFVEVVDAYALRSGTDSQTARIKAERYLREIAATHSPYVIDLIANAIHALYQQGYGEIRYSHSEIDTVAHLGSEHPIVFLPSHRSNMDRLALQFMLWENDLPPNHTAGGINLNFFPIGPLMRRTGVFFIRRSFKDNELYKIVLRSYIDYLIEKRFPLEWYLEGGRSRSGKLNPPRYGLLNYVVDSLRRGKSDEVVLIPVSIAYDQIQDVPDYAREAQGREKERESLGWLVRAIRSLRRRYGDIHIRFAEPLPVSKVLGEIDEDDEASLGLQKLAFEVMYRIGRVTPITPIAVVGIVLLAGRGKARTAAEISEECQRLVTFIERRELPTTEDLSLLHRSKVLSTLNWLEEHKNVSSHEAIGRRVFWLEDDQGIRISYYRNMVVHFFLNRAVADIALAAMASARSRELSLMRSLVLQLRDLLKFEFFFPEKDRFVDDVFADIEVDIPGWEAILSESGPQGVLERIGEPVAQWAVLPFLDAYQIVGDELESARGPFDEKRFLAACLDRARMYRIEERLISGESASQVLFKSALSLAANRGLLDDTDDVSERRASFAAEVKGFRDLAASGL